MDCWMAGWMDGWMDGGLIDDVNERSKWSEAKRAKRIYASSNPAN